MFKSRGNLGYVNVNYTLKHASSQYRQLTSVSLIHFAGKLFYMYSSQHDWAVIFKLSFITTKHKTLSPKFLLQIMIINLPLDIIIVSQVMSLMLLLNIVENDNSSHEINQFPSGQIVKIGSTVTAPISISVIDLWNK